MNATYTRYRNWLSRRAWERCKVPLPDRITRRLGSLPGYRNRINRATGRPHRDDMAIGAVQDRAMARRRPAAAGRAARAAANQRAVRDTLAARQPQYARTLDRAAGIVGREMAVRRPRTRTRAGRSRLWSRCATDCPASTSAGKNSPSTP